MYRLSKIKELKGYRFFRDFEWDENNCKLFERNNLIYGWNGSGKTTLCDFFKELETGQFLGNGTKLSLLFKDTDSKDIKTITHNSLGTVPYVFRVFHQEYIQDTISKVDNVKHIFAIGSNQKEYIDELKALKSKQKSEKTLLESLKSEQSSLEVAFEQAKSSKAAQIKSTANYSAAYNKNKFFIAYKALSTPSTLSDKEFQELLTAIRTEQKPSMPLFSIDFIKPSVKEYIDSILTETPVNVTIEELKSDAETNNWVESGLKIHDNKAITVCQFCGNIISIDRFDALRAHFNQSYKELSTKIDNAISLLKTKSQQFDTIVNELPDPDLLYAELRGQYTILQRKAYALCKNNTSAIKKIILILQHKKEDMINDQYTKEFDTVASELIFDYVIFNQILDLFVKHNNKSSDFKKSIEAAQKKIEDHLITQFASEIKATEEAIVQKSSEVLKKTEEIRLLGTKITELEQEVNNSQIPAEAMNKDIEFIMGRDELVFDNKPTGYQITRKGKIAKNLSKGEENAISLIYFFNALSDINSDVQNTIVVLDDPISSFDSNFYYNAISYIRDKTRTAGQVFVFTHKFSLLKDYSMMYKGETNRYLIRRINNNPQLENEDYLISQYHDEYAYLFKQVYQFVKEPPSNPIDYLQYANIARRLLEGFLTFKLPNSDTLINKVLSLEEGKSTAAGHAMLRLLNNHSHLRVIRDSQMADDISHTANIPSILRHLLAFIKCYDLKHFSVLAEMCDPVSSNHDNDQFDWDDVLFTKHTSTEKYTVNLYTDMPASAGIGNSPPDDEHCEKIEVTNPQCSFAVRISGHSMEPDIPDQSIVLVKQSEKIPNTHIGLFLYEDKTYCKKLIDTGQEILLVSINKKFKPIKVKPSTELRTFGEVVEVLSPSLI